MEEKKIRVLETFPFWNQFISILLLSRSHLNFFVWFQAFIVFCFPRICYQQLRPPSHQKKNQINFFYHLALSSTSLFHVLFNIYINMYVLLFNLLHIYILFSFIIIQFIFNIIFLCMILPAWGTLDCEKLDICFSPQKGHLRTSFLCIYSSNIFFSVEYESTKHGNDIIFQFGMKSVGLQTLK